MEHTALNVVVHGFLGDAKFWVNLQNLVRGEPLLKEGSDNGGHCLSLSCSQVYALPGINEGFPIIKLGIFGGIGVLVESTAAPAGAPIAGTGGAVSPGTAEGNILRAIGSTLASMDALAVSGAFQRKAAFVGHCSVEFDLLAHSGLVLANSLCNGGFCGAVGDTG